MIEARVITQLMQILQAKSSTFDEAWVYRITPTPDDVINKVRGACSMVYQCLSKISDEHVNYTGKCQENILGA